MEAILLDPVPAGIANPVPAGNASAASASNSPFANLLASSRDDGARDDADGRGADGASAAAALLALLLPQPQGLPQAIAAADGNASIAIDAASLDGQPSPPGLALGLNGLDGEPSPPGLALGLNGLAPGQNDLETVPGKALSLASGTPGTDEDPLLPSMKQGRGDTPSTTTGLAKTVSLSLAAQSQPATSTPLPPELIGDAAGEGDRLKVSASKTNETLAASNSNSAAATPSAADAIDGAEPPKPVAAEAPPPVKPAVPQIDDRAADARRDEDIDGPTSIATGSIDRPHSLGATNAAHTAVEKLANLIQHPELLAAHIERAVANGRDRISIALVPADLGRIDISLDFERGGKISAVIAVDRPQTLELLQRDQRGLERALQDAGFKTDSGSLSFNLRGDQRQQQNPSTPWAPTRQADDPWLAANRPLPQPAALARLVADGRLDIEV